jgi:hypothetical protein
MSLERDLLEEFGTTTFSEVWVQEEHKALGWSGGTVDDRDWRLEDFIGTGSRAEVQSGRKLWANPLQLNQGREGACVGFAHVGVSNSQPAKHEYGNERGFQVYHLAQDRFDPFPGNKYPGTTVRAGAKAQVYLGEYTHYAFTNSVEVLALHILNYGSATIGVDWFTGMDRVDSEGFIHPSGKLMAGHSVVIDGVTWNYEGVKPNRFRFRNSWGSYWGFNGRGWISAIDLQFLFNRGGTSCVPVEVPNG